MSTGSNFVDYVKIYCRSGKGGAGSAHLHRAKYLPKGGPDGGDGGRGGHIILRGNKHLWTLIHLKYARHIFARDGDPGSRNRRTGKDGEDQIIEVPLGTVVYDGENGEFLTDVKEHGQEIIILRGGKGGKGNWHFKSSTNQTPRYAQPGEPRLEQTLILQLKVLADVGLVGFPNVGKSTLLSVVSAAKPEIADYPFTTLVPNLGIVSYRDSRSFVMADIPGIIEGASEGKGLGLRFLRHIERNSILLFIIPADSKDLNEEYNILLSELEKYNPHLINKQRILAISKSDMLDEELIEEMEKELPEDIKAVFFSSVTGMGINQLKDMIWSELNSDYYEDELEVVYRPMEIEQIEEPETETEEDPDSEWDLPVDYWDDEEEDLSKYKGVGWDEQDEIGEDGE